MLHAVERNRGADSATHILNLVYYGGLVARHTHIERERDKERAREREKESERKRKRER